MKELPERFFGFFKRYIYVIAVVVAVVSFGWIRKKIKSSFLGDIRGKKKRRKDGEENSFSCLVLFISNGMKQSGLRACLDRGLWHWCNSHGVVKSVQVPNAAHSSRRSHKGAKPPHRVRELQVLPNPSLGKANCLDRGQPKIFFCKIYQSAPEQHYQHSRVVDQLKYFSNLLLLDRRGLWMKKHEELLTTVQ